MGSSSHDLGAELRMHSSTVNCDTFSNEEKVAAVVPVTSVEETCSEAMLALSFSALLVKCLMKILGRSSSSWRSIASDEDVSESYGVSAAQSWTRKCDHTGGMQQQPLGQVFFLCGPGAYD